MANLNQARTPLSLATLLALGISGVSLIASGYLFLRSGSSSGGGGECRDGELRAEVEKLRWIAAGAANDPANPAAVRALSERVALLENTMKRMAESGIKMPEGVSSVPHEMAAKLVSPNKAVSVEETSPGNYAVFNTDPALAGQRMVVKRRGADGKMEDVSILVPPPPNEDMK